MFRGRSILAAHALALAWLTISPVNALAEEAAKDAAKPDAPQAAPAAPAAPAPAPAQSAEDRNAAARKAHEIRIKAEAFPETTAVHGEIKTDLQGIWLLLTRAEIAPGKFRNFPQLIKITKGKEGLAFQLLDVQLPADVTKSFQDADRTLAAWDPSSDVRASLGKGWSTLPKIAEKSLNDPPRGKVEYVIVSPERYADVFGAANAAVQTALKESVFGMQIVETYTPIPGVADTQISQLMQRKVLYGAKSAEKDVVRGTSFVGFIASGNGTPLPLQFGGQFVMYRIATVS